MWDGISFSFLSLPSIERKKRKNRAQTRAQAVSVVTGNAIAVSCCSIHAHRDHISEHRTVNFWSNELNFRMVDRSVLTQPFLTRTHIPHSERSDVCCFRSIGPYWERAISTVAAKSFLWKNESIFVFFAADCRRQNKNKWAQSAYLENSIPFCSESTWKYFAGGAVSASIRYWACPIIYAFLSNDFIELQNGANP